MKERARRSTPATTLFARRARYLLVVASAVAMLVIAAAPVRASSHQHHHYKLIVLGTLGGPNSYGDPGHGAFNINDRGIAVGTADTAAPDPNFPTYNPLLTAQNGGVDSFLFHVFQAKNGFLVDLGTLPGPNSSSASYISENGLVSGQSLNGTIDPLTGFPAENAVLWEDGKIVNLGTLGGYESGAGWVNSRGQVVGFSSNTIPDPLSFFGVVTQTRAFIWQKGKMDDLGTLGGPDAVAIFINEQGQAAGLSYTNSTPNAVTTLPTTDPFLWDKGKMIDLGSLGGTFGGPGETAALNNRGQVVGASNLAGDLTSHAFLWPGKDGKMQDLGTLGGSNSAATAINDAGEVIGLADTADSTHGFFWKNGQMTDIGTLAGDCFSGVFGINDRGQVVGGSISCDMVTTRAFLWEDDEIIDLNVFLPLGTAFTLTNVEQINERGEVFGMGILSDGEGVSRFLCV